MVVQRELSPPEVTADQVLKDAADVNWSILDQMKYEDILQRHGKEIVEDAEAGEEEDAAKGRKPSAGTSGYADKNKNRA